jgi:isochorismate pyruvate lyase
MITLEKEPADMAAVRREIDRLDRALVALMAERQRYIEAAGRIKKSRTKVRDEDRINDVLTKVIAHAQIDGLNPDIAVKTWRAMMEGFIEYEFEVFDAVKASPAKA